MSEKNQKQARGYSSVAISPQTLRDLKARAEEMNVSGKDFADASIEFFIRNRINPTLQKKKGMTDITVELLELKKKSETTHNTFVAFIRKQESDLLKPMKAAIEELNRATKKSEAYMREIIISVGDSEIAVLKEMFKQTLHFQILQNLTYESLFEPRHIKARKQEMQEWFDKEMDRFFEAQIEKTKRSKERLTDLKRV